ncbi:MAG: hypothetical protein Q8R07_03510 [Candidatus Uhrbacteria bacterium]|nr:hypothetical protein [Candidatus Uhrbacteria bacterium]
MPVIHQGLAAGRWSQFTLMEQLGHVGSEVDRAIHWSVKQSVESSQNAIDRALELLDLTIADPRWRHRLRELTRAREVLCDHFYGSNEYDSSDASLQKYFLDFALAARKNK